MITLKTIGAFLPGRRAAIETIANGNKAIFLLALLFIDGFVKLAGRVPSRFETFTNFGAFLRCFLMTILPKIPRRVTEQAPSGS